VSGVSEGSLVAVTINPNAVFQVGREEMGEDGGFSIAGLSFARRSGFDGGAGRADPAGKRSSAVERRRLTTDLVRLWPSQITGQVGSIDLSSRTFTFDRAFAAVYGERRRQVTTIKVGDAFGDGLHGLFRGQGRLVRWQWGDTVSVKACCSIQRECRRW